MGPFRALARNGVPFLLRHFSDGKKFKKFSVDRTGLLGSKYLFEEQERTKIESNVVKEPLTPLARDLLSYIKLKGPITLHDYMAQCLNHLMHGYYQKKGEVIGEHGDFITAPEISQLYGEMIGIWCVSTWESLGTPENINIVELGPGKGTLMKDILRVAERFPAFNNAVSVHFVELSLSLRRKQLQLLVNHDDLTSTVVETNKYEANNSVKTPIHWYSFLNQVPTNAPLLIIGQEFLDAFPVHQFSYTSKGWREKLVDTNSNSSNSVGSSSSVILTKPQSPSTIKKKVQSSETNSNISDEIERNNNKDGDDLSAAAASSSLYHFRMVLSPTATPAVKSLLSHSSIKNVATGARGYGNNMFDNSSSSNSDNIDTNQNISSSSVTNATTPLSSNNTTTTISSPSIGDGIEICPLAIATCEDIAQKIVKAGGAALLVDYGEKYTQEDTLRAFQNHKQIHIFSQPGTADMTADVDFSMCRQAALSRGAVVPDIMTQGEFLMQMGIVQRIEQLFALDSTTEEQGDALIESLKYLVEPQQMGQKFKVMTILSPKISSRVAMQQNVEIDCHQQQQQQQEAKDQQQIKD